RLARREPRLQIVPEADPLLAVLPAQPDVAPLALAEEVAQPDVDVLDRHSGRLDGLQLLGHRLHERAKDAARAEQLGRPRPAGERLLRRRLAELLQLLKRDAELSAELQH